MHNVMSCRTASTVLAVVDPVDLIIMTVSVLCAVFLSIWIVAYSGPLALRGCPVRRNRLPAYVPLVYLVVWQLLALAAMMTIRYVLEDWSPRIVEFANYVANTCINIVMIAATLVVARYTFVKRLKGFGLSLGTVVKDFAAAVINFLTVLPLVWLGVVLVELAGKSIVGPGFEIGANEGLDVLTEHPHPAMRLLMLTYLAVLVPVFEEVLFRGLIQTTARSYLNSPWLAIVITSLVFALLHPMLHWPAILILSLGMGYAYERSGSLLRPIFIHIFFNTTTVCAVLLSN